MCIYICTCMYSGVVYACRFLSEADRVVVMEDGRIVRCGLPSNVLSTLNHPAEGRGLSEKEEVSEKTDDDIQVPIIYICYIYST